MHIDNMLIYVVAEFVFDKKTHKKLFCNEIEFERFYRYLRYASVNTFIHLVPVFEDKIIELLEDYEQMDAADWFAEAMTKEEGHWMLAHAGPGLSNTNCSLEVNWIIMKEALLMCWKVRGWIQSVMDAK